MENNETKWQFLQFKPHRNHHYAIIYFKFLRFPLPETGNLAHKVWTLPKEYHPLLQTVKMNYHNLPANLPILDSWSTQNSNQKNTILSTQSNCNPHRHIYRRFSSSVSKSCISIGSGKISLDNLLCEEEYPFVLVPLPWDPNRPACFRPLCSSLFASLGKCALSNELLRQLPKKAALQDRLDEVVLSLEELKLSSLTTLKGFSKALRMCLIKGRFEGLGLRHDLATIATAHTSSSRSSSTIRDWSTILAIGSFSYILMNGRFWSNHSLLRPSLPVTSSSKTFPKQYTS